jgi:hypothetical protein
MRQLFGTVDAAGSHISMPEFDATQRFEIVGVVADTKLNSLREQAAPVAYVPFFQAEYRGTSSMPASIEVRLTPDSTLGAAELQRVIEAAFAGLHTGRVLPQSALVRRALARETLLTAVSASLGLIATLLVAFGLAGAVAQSVVTRAKEFGIRLALGARGSDLIVRSAGRAMAPVAVGVAIGVPLSLSFARLLRSELFGVEAFDPMTVVAAILFLLMITAGAALVPASRAIRIDPAAAIRQD